MLSLYNISKNIAWRIFLLIFLQQLSCLYGQEQIHEINFEGIKRSKKDYVLRFIQSKVGDPYDSLKVVADIQALRNVQIFSKVHAKVSRSLKGISLTFQTEEVITIFPFLDFGDVRGNRYVQVGMIDFHWLGKGNTLGGFYRYDGRSSFQGFHKNPYVNQTKWGYNTSFLKLSTTEPLFFRKDGQDPNDILDYERVNYLYDNYTAEALATYEFRFGHNVQLGGAYIFERYEQLDSTELVVPGRQALHKWAIKSVYTNQKIDYYLQYLQGFSQELFAEAVFTIGEEEPFWKVLSISRYYHRIGKSGNLAARVRLGLSQNTDSPFVPFVLDSYVNIRGSGNRVARGTGEVVVNLEYRHSLYQPTWGAVQAVGFWDMGSWRFPNNENGTFGFSSSTAFTGAGLRLYFAKVFNLTLRADYGVNINDRNNRGWVLGVGQYF